jgi:hypothetical protein
MSLGKEQYMRRIMPRPRIVIEAQGVGNSCHIYHVNRRLTSTGYSGWDHDRYVTGRTYVDMYHPDEATFVLGTRLRAIPGVDEDLEIRSSAVILKRLTAFDWQRIDYEVVMAIMEHLGWHQTAPLGRLVQCWDAVRVVSYELKDRLNGLLYSVDIVRVDFYGDSKPQQCKPKRRRRGSISGNTVSGSASR